MAMANDEPPTVRITANNHLIRSTRSVVARAAKRGTS